MTYYIGLVHKDEDSSFGVQFPDVPGCFSAADDMDDLVANAAEALSLWAEDEALPEPRAIEEIVKDKAIKRELAGAEITEHALIASALNVDTAEAARMARAG